MYQGVQEDTVVYQGRCTQDVLPGPGTTLSYPVLGTPSPVTAAWCTAVHVLVVSRSGKNSPVKEDPREAWVRWSFLLLLLRVVTVLRGLSAGVTGRGRARTGNNWIANG